MLRNKCEFIFSFRGLFVVFVKKLTPLSQSWVNEHTGLISGHSKTDFRTFQGSDILPKYRMTSGCSFQLTRPCGFPLHQSEAACAPPVVHLCESVMWPMGLEVLFMSTPAARARVLCACSTLHALVYTLNTMLLRIQGTRGSA